MLTLVAVPVVATGCGGASGALGNVVAHKIANHFAKTPGERRAVNLAFCALSVDQLFKNIRHHHLIYGAASAALALKNCEAGFKKNSP